MPRRRCFFSAIFALALLGIDFTGHAAFAGNTAVARAHVEQAANAAIGLVQRKDISAVERQAALARLLRDNLEIPFIARIVLGKAWRKASPEQQQRFTEVFEDHLIRTIVRGLESYNIERLTVQKVTAKGEKDLLVHSQIERPDGEPVKTVWRVRQFGGTPRIIDLTVEGISMVITKREEFAAVVKSQGLDALMQVLQVNSQSAEAANS